MHNRLTRKQKADILAAFTPPEMVGALASIDIKTRTQELLVGADIHFIIEHKSPSDNLGWVGIYWSDAPHAFTTYNFNTGGNTAYGMDLGVHPFGRLRQRDYDFFARLAGVRGDGPDPNGLPPDASVMAKRVVGQWGLDGHSHSHLTLREFVKRKVISDESISEAAKFKLSGGDPIADFLNGVLDDGHEADLTLDDNTRVVFFFDN